jgi:hypothetical protein
MGSCDPSHPRHFGAGRPRRPTRLGLSFKMPDTTNTRTCLQSYYGDEYYIILATLITQKLGLRVLLIHVAVQKSTSLSHPIKATVACIIMHIETLKHERRIISVGVRSLVEVQPRPRISPSASHLSTELRMIPLKLCWSFTVAYDDRIDST